MYLKLLIFDKKETCKYGKPIFNFEANGEHAIEKMISAIIRWCFGSIKDDEIEKKIMEIKDIIYKYEHKKELN
jgi:predicted metal-dependent peptidase